MIKVKLLVSCAVACCLSSCVQMQMYSFYQVCETKPVNQESNFTNTYGGLLYETEYCDVLYDFWSEGGAIGFNFYNKTDSIIYIDLKKTFFIKNRTAYDYFLNREQELDIVAVPPHALKRISEYSINNTLYLDCDLCLFPAAKATMNFTVDNSPLIFSNYITYHVGLAGEYKVIDNQFYLSSVTNYSEPFAITFVEREEKCENKKNTAKDITPKTIKLYDRCWKITEINTSSSFYLKYDIRSNNILYKKGRRYYYNANYDAYVKSESEASIGRPTYVGEPNSLLQSLAPTF